MLTIFDRADKSGPFCDGMSRRNFLRIGALGAAGVTLPQLLRAEAAAGIRGSKKSVILIYLVGGPPHQDMFDLKPDAPVEVRGPFNPIKTNVPGIEICEEFPMMARMMDKFTVIRSLCDAQNDHNAYQCFTGRDQRQPKPTGDWPQFGTAISKLQGPYNRGVPPFMSLCYTCTHGPYNEPGPGFLGVSHSGFRPLGDGRADMTLRGITTDRLSDRISLLKSLDHFRRSADTSGKMLGLDAFNEQALGVLTSSRLAEALDLSNEDPKVVERYGTGDPKKKMDGNGAPRVPQSFLVARRLIEAGARVVTVNYSKWDWHGGPNNSIFKREREDFPALDKAITALVEDLHQRGLDKETTVLMWGEFGRTPKISKIVGRDHWPNVAQALLAGGGMPNGQIIGATDRLAGEPVDRPVRFAEVFATLYRNLGINVDRTTVRDLHGRPQYLVDGEAHPLKELM